MDGAFMRKDHTEDLIFFQNDECVNDRALGASKYLLFALAAALRFAIRGRRFPLSMNHSFIFGLINIALRRMRL